MKDECPICKTSLYTVLIGKRGVGIACSNKECDLYKPPYTKEKEPTILLRSDPTLVDRMREKEREE